MFKELIKYINKCIIEPIINCFKRDYQDSRQQVKCDWIACANNISGVCSCKDVKLKNVTIDNVNYLKCDSFDFE